MPGEYNYSIKFNHVRTKIIENKTKTNQTKVIIHSKPWNLELTEIEYDEEEGRRDSYW